MASVDSKHRKRASVADHDGQDKTMQRYMLQILAATAVRLAAKTEDSSGNTLPTSIARNLAHRDEAIFGLGAGALPLGLALVTDQSDRIPGPAMRCGILHRIYMGFL